jgi:hypothetical protein
MKRKKQYDDWGMKPELEAPGKAPKIKQFALQLPIEVDWTYPTYDRLALGVLLIIRNVGGGLKPSIFIYKTCVVKLWRK